MILIISSIDDLSTNEVIDWLDFYSAPYMRICSTDTIFIKKLVLSDEEPQLVFSIDNEIIDWKNIKAVWYRRSFLNLSSFTIKSDLSTNIDFQINAQMKHELQILKDAFWNILQTKSINTEAGNKLNKLLVLDACRLVGIKIPKTIITSSKKDLRTFFDEVRGGLITKNYSPGLFISDDEGYFSTETRELNLEMLNSLNDCFAPILAQKNIEKAFELRIFYLLGECYSSAIFSQNDDKTKTDFRNYNWEKPNRTPPYSLPVELRNKIIQLMKIVELNSGSIDILVDTKGDYFFLEINPVGQFKQVSLPCNYQLEKKIAQTLTKNEQQY